MGLKKPEKDIIRDSSLDTKRGDPIALEVVNEGFFLNLRALNVVKGVLSDEFKKIPEKIYSEV